MKFKDVMETVLDKPVANPDEVDQKELAMGIEVEYEHTSNKKIATRIALSHLKEFSDYYTRLKKMEAEGDKAKKENK